MEFEYLENTQDIFDVGLVSPAEAAQDERDAAARAAGEAKDRAYQEELSGTVAGRMERFGVGPNAKLAGLDGARAKRTADRFIYHAAMLAYQQPVTLNIGGRNLTMSLGDLRSVATDLHNRYKGKDPAKAKAYEDLIRLTDHVAANRAASGDLGKFIDANGLDQDISQALSSRPDITPTHDTALKAGEADRNGEFRHQTAAELNAAGIGDLYPGR